MVDRIVLMGKQGRSMLSQAKKAFEGRDVELARDLVRQDDLIDNLNKECFQIAVQVGEDKDTREWAMTMMLVARHWSGSATTPWTSANRSPSWSPACSASSRTPPTQDRRHFPPFEG